MVQFKVKEILFENWSTVEELHKINNSSCDDILAQIIFSKIRKFAKTTSMLMHNENYGRQHLQDFLFVMLIPALMSDKGDTAEAITERLEISQKLFNPPSPIYKKVVNRKMFSEKAIVDISPQPVQLMFNPYMLSILISNVYFNLRHSRVIKNWCQTENLRFESIEKVAEIIEDKYSYRFIDMYNISADLLIKSANASNIEKIEIYKELTGLDGKFLNAFANWSNIFLEKDLLPGIKELLSSIRYSD